MLKEFLNEDNLIICPNILKEKVVKELNDLFVSFKVMDINEFNNNFFYAYDINANLYIMANYNKSYKESIEILKYLYFIKDIDYKIEKLNELRNIKNSLINNNLLKENILFKEYFKKVNTIIYGYNLDLFYKELFKSYNVNYIINNDNYKNIDVYEFKQMEDEIVYVLNDIIDKINNNVDINNIKLIISKEYNFLLENIFNISNIKVNLKLKTSLYELDIVKEIINALKDNKSFQEIIDNLNINKDILKKIITIFNKYIDIYSNPNLIEILTYEFKNTYLTNPKYNNAIDIIDIDEIDNKNYNYLLGFNNENYPSIYKDNDYLIDEYKKILKLDTSTIKNKKERDKILNIIYNSNNLFISYKEKDLFNTYLKTILLNDNFNIIKDNKIKYNFSHKYNLRKLINEYDNYYKYNIVSNDLTNLISNYNDFKYNTYDNSFKANFNNLFKDKIVYSYSSLDNYYNCHFKYYLDNVLKIKEIDTDPFKKDLGSICHYILSKYKDKDFDFEKLWDKEIEKYNIRNNNLLLLDKIKNELKYDIDTIKKQEEYSKLDNYLFEKEIVIDIEKDAKFKGFIDKLIYKEIDNNTYVSIIDYKTGNYHADIKKFKYGLDLQLPTYVFLIKNSNLFKNVKIVGFYIQKIMNGDIKFDIKKSIDDIKYSNLKLKGYSNSDKDIISLFDINYENSNYITSLKTTKDGSFQKSAKVLNTDEINSLSDLVYNHIISANKQIHAYDFHINPIKLNNEIIGCKYCKYRDICFRRDKDFKEIIDNEIVEDFTNEEA